jgi:sec-independent protein translocase protein TatB
MFDIGFWELLIIAVVLLLVMGPERLPEVAKQAAFLVRKARRGMYRLRSEMQGELSGTPFGDLEKAKQEMRDLKRDIQQFGRDLADSAEEKIGDDKKPVETATSDAEQPKKPSKDDKSSQS